MKVYNGAVYFDDWLEAEGYKPEENIRLELAAEGKTEGEIEDHVQEIFEKFENWAESEGYQPQYA